MIHNDLCRFIGRHIDYIGFSGFNPDDEIFDDYILTVITFQVACRVYLLAKILNGIKKLCFLVNKCETEVLGPLQIIVK